jgi:hypothetical protein
MRPLLGIAMLAGLSVPAFAQVGDCSAEQCPVILELESVEVDTADTGWEASDGRITQIDENGSTGTYSWSAPPRTVTFLGFAIELTLDGTAMPPDAYYAPTLYVSGPFNYEPDPPQLPLYLQGNQGQKTMRVTVTPWRPNLAGGTYTLDVGAAWGGPVVHYVYRTVPQLIP